MTSFSLLYPPIAPLTFVVKAPVALAKLKISSHEDSFNSA